MPKTTTKGFSLIEFMIASVIGLILIAAVLGVYISIVKSNAHNIKSIYLTQDLRTTQSIITKDIKRIGYWPTTRTTAWLNTELTLSSASVGTATIQDTDNTGLFAQMGTDIVNLRLVGKNGDATITQYVNSNNIQVNITQAFDSPNLQPGTWTFVNPFTLIYPTTPTPANCLLFTYSMDNDNTLDNNERIGYRLSNNTIQMFQSGTFDCNNGTWEDMTSPTTNVTNLQFSLNNDTLDVDDTGPGTSNITSRNLTVTMTAEDVSDTTINLTLIKTAKIVNDLFTP